MKYKKALTEFIDSGQFAFIPDRQRDKNRHRWHVESEELGLTSKTIKIWRNVRVCTVHNRPIAKYTGVGPEAYDSDYECSAKYRDEIWGLTDYGEHICLRSEKVCLLKLRTVVIFSEEASKTIQNMNIVQVKEYLVQHGIIKKVNSKFLA